MFPRQACKSDYRNKMPRNFSQFPGNPIILNPTIVVFFPRPRLDASHVCFFDIVMDLFTSPNLAISECCSWHFFCRCSVVSILNVSLAMNITEWMSGALLPSSMKRKVEAWAWWREIRRRKRQENRLVPITGQWRKRGPCELRSPTPNALGWRDQLCL